MRYRRGTARLLLAWMVLNAAGCANGGGTGNVEMSDQLATFAADFLRQVLAAFVL